MSGQPPGAAGVPPPRNTSNGASNVAMAMPPQQRPNDGQVGVGGVGGQNGNIPPQNLNSIVSDNIFSSKLQLFALVFCTGREIHTFAFLPCPGTEESFPSCCYTMA